MSTEEQEVIERPDDYEVTPPTEGDFITLEPFKIFTANTKDHKSTLMILNTPIDGMNLPQLWSNTELHICVDGGANRLHDYFNQLSSNPDTDRQNYIPHIIVGDCDSLKPEIRQYYELRGAHVIKQNTQYSTDFMKAMYTIILYHHNDQLRDKLLRGDFAEHDGLGELMDEYILDKSDPDHYSEGPSFQVYALGGIGGRFDQTVHSINQLYTLKRKFPLIRIYLITDSDLIFLLNKGKNYVKYPSRNVFSNVVGKTPICGLLPFGKEVSITSHGLKYDVKNWKLSIDGNVSSSNGISAVSGFTVELTEDIVMSVELSLDKN